MSPFFCVVLQSNCLYDNRSDAVWILVPEYAKYPKVKEASQLSITTDAGSRTPNFEQSTPSADETTRIEPKLKKGSLYCSSRTTSSVSSTRTWKLTTKGALGQNSLPELLAYWLSRRLPHVQRSILDNWIPRTAKKNRKIYIRQPVLGGRKIRLRFGIEDNSVITYPQSTLLVNWSTLWPTGRSLCTGLEPSLRGRQVTRHDRSEEVSHPEALRISVSAWRFHLSAEKVHQ